MRLGLGRIVPQPAPQQVHQIVAHEGPGRELIAGAGVVKVALRGVGVRRLQREAADRRRHRQRQDRALGPRVGGLAKDLVRAAGANLKHERPGCRRIEVRLIAVGAPGRHGAPFDGVRGPEVLAVELCLEHHVGANARRQREDLRLARLPGSRRQRHGGRRLLHAGHEGVLVPGGRSPALAGAEAEHRQARHPRGDVGGRLANVGLQVAVGEGLGGISIETGRGRVGHEPDADPARGGHGDHAVEHGQVAIAIGGGRPDVGEGRRPRQVEQRVREHGRAEVVHAVKVEHVEARVRQQIEVGGPKLLVEEPPARLAGVRQHPEQVRGPERHRGSGARHARRRNGAGTVEADALGDLQRAVHRADRIAPDDPGDAVDGGDHERFRAGIEVGAIASLTGSTAGSAMEAMVMARVVCASARAWATAQRP